MKTNVSIKFNSVEEYQEIEKKLLELGYIKDYNYCSVTNCKYVYIHLDSEFNIYNFVNNEKVYNSLQEFLNDK